MSNFLAFLNGKKSYIGAAFIAIASFMELAGIDPSLTTAIKELGEAILGVGIAHKLVKAG